jgi:WD40 repeat protein
MGFGKTRATICAIALLGVAALGFAAGGAEGDMPVGEPKPALPRLDRYGDPLPPGAVARLGTKRMSHRDGVEFVQFTPDGKDVISGSRNPWLDYWDVAQGARRHDFKAAGSTFAFALSSNGKRFASIGDQATILLGDLDTGKQLAELSGYQKDIWALALTGDGRLLASSGDENRVGLWDAAKGKPLRELLGHKGRLGALTFSPDSKTLAAAGEDDNLFLWSTSTGVVTKRLPVKTKTRALAFAPGGNLLACATENGLQVWDIQTEKILWQERQVGGINPTVVFAPDGQTLAFAIGEAIHLRDVAGGKRLGQMTGHHESVHALAFSPDSKRLVSGGADYAVRLWDVAGGKEYFPEHRNFGRIMSAQFLADGKTVLVRNENVLVWWSETVWFWDPVQGKELHSFKAGTPGQLRDHVLSPDGTRIAQVMSDGELRVRAVPSGQLLHKLPGKPRSFQHIAFSPDNKLLVDATYIGPNLLSSKISRDVPDDPVSVSVRVVELATAKVVREFPNQPWRSSTPQEFSIRFSADGRFVVGWFHLKMGFHFDVGTGELQMFDPPVLGVPDGAPQKLVVVPGKPPTQPRGKQEVDERLWEYLVAEVPPGLQGSANRRTVGKFTLPYEHATHIVLPGNRIVASAWDATIRLWSIPTGKEIARFSLPLLRHGRTFREYIENGGNAVMGLDASADGRLLVSGHFNGTALVWDLTPYHAQARLAGAPLDDPRLAELWTDLGDTDAAKGWRAVWTLAEHAEQSVKMLQARMQPERAPDPKVAAGWIRDLGDANFAVRTKAMSEIRPCGRMISHLLRAALADNPPVEVQRRLQLLLAEIAQPEAMTPARMRQWRALEALEQINTPAAAAIAKTLAGGAPEAWLTKQAAAVERRMFDHLRKHAAPDKKHE